MIERQHEQQLDPVFNPVVVFALRKRWKRPYYTCNLRKKKQKEELIYTPQGHIH